MSDTPLTDAVWTDTTQNILEHAHNMERKLAITRAALERILHPHHSRDAATPPSWAIAAEALEATKP